MELNTIPLGNGDDGKDPSCGTGWQNRKNFETNNDLVKTKKSKMYGVLCGKHNNLIVIDYTIHKLEKTVIDLSFLKRFHGASAYIVQTLSGFHVYHTYETRFKGWRGMRGVQGYIDIKNTRDYVIGGKSVGCKEVSGNIKRLTPMPDEVFSYIDTGVKKMLRRSPRIGCHYLTV